VRFIDLLRPGLFPLTLIIVTAVLLGTNLPGKYQLIYALQDSGHYLIFALLSLTALWPYRKNKESPIWQVMLSCLIFGLSIEAVQHLIGRDPSLYDALMDLLGITAGTILYSGIIRRSLSPHLSIVILLALTLTAFSLPIYWFTVYQVRAAQFPRLIDPGNFFSRALIEGSNGGEVRHIEVPKDWLMPADSDFDSCANVSLLEGRWPGLKVQEPEADWRGYEKLELNIYSEQSIDLPLVLRIHDQNHNRQFDDRYNRRLLVHPGYNTISLPLSEIEQAPKARPMDLSDISEVMIYASHEYAGKGFCLITMGLR
jgi:VanZ family protein